jgi:hypothetical protein
MFIVLGRRVWVTRAARTGGVGGGGGEGVLEQTFAPNALPSMAAPPFVFTPKQQPHPATTTTTTSTTTTTQDTAGQGSMAKGGGPP